MHSGKVWEVFYAAGGKRQVRVCLSRVRSAALRQLVAVVSIAALGGCFWLNVPEAGAIEITIPRRSHLTPVQRLNREGVKAVQKHDYKKAEALFLKAYLYDPSDPFTLNNIGYISELEGNLLRAEKFYKLSAEQGSGAQISLSSAKQLEGQPMNEAFASLKSVPMRVNQLNLEAVEQIHQGRNQQALALLNKAIALEPHDAFTLNNLGVVNEAMGNFRTALKNYAAAANSPHASGKVVLALQKSSEGKPIGEVASESAKRLKARLERTGTVRAEAAALSLRGVAAANQNDWDAARADFLKAYSLDPESGFAMNNRGYVAEREGDLETAQFFYDKAQQAANASSKVGLATAQTAEGKRIRSVAVSSSRKVGAELTTYSEQRRKGNEPIELIPREPNGSPAQLNQNHPNQQTPPPVQGQAPGTASPPPAAPGTQEPQ